MELVSRTTLMTARYGIGNQIRVSPNNGRIVSSDQPEVPSVIGFYAKLIAIADIRDSLS
jgi:hypothetical protein